MDEGSGIQDDEVFKLAPFNPSSDQIQEKALELLKLSADDVLFDLGCGDGRLLCSAAEKCPGLRCVGVEVDPVFATRAKERAEKLPSDVRSRIDIRLEDVLKIPMTTDGTNKPTRETSVSELTLLDDAMALYLFVLPKGIVKLMPILNALVEKRNRDCKRIRILTYMFKIHDWEPILVDKTAKGGCPIYYYEFGGSSS